MNEKDITKLCLAVSLIGIIIIYIADTSSEPRKIAGAEITQGLAGERVMLCGKIHEVRTTENGTSFFKVDDGAKTDVVLFENRATEANLARIKKGAKVCVSGTIEQYHGKMELVASKIA